MKTCDIIIPTYNNERVLKSALEAVVAQEVPAGWKCRVILSDDGSRDTSLSIAQAVTAPSTWRNLLVVQGNHTGVAGARNRALNVADADVIFFLGADIVLRPGVLQQHLTFHDKNPDTLQAALGMVVWDPKIQPTPLMEWMIHGGSQNDFDNLLGVEEADAKHSFYCSHLSLKRKALDGLQFNEQYTVYGWEDLDLGRRLSKKGLRLKVLHSAVGHHVHRYSVSDIYARQYVIGKSLPEYQQQFPQESIGPVLSPRRKVKVLFYTYSGLRGLGRLLMKTWAPKYALPRIFMFITAAEFWRGVYSS